MTASTAQLKSVVDSLQQRVDEQEEQQRRLQHELDTPVALCSDQKPCASGALTALQARKEKLQVSVEEVQTNLSCVEKVCWLLLQAYLPCNETV